MYYDSHSHLQLGNDSDEKKKNYEVLLEKNVIGHLICNSTSEQDYKHVEELSNQFDNVIPSYGIHPWYIDSCKLGWLERLKSRLIHSEHAFIGEIGLDKKRSYGLKQKKIFESQLKLALELNRPASIHCVRCHGTMFEILKKYLPLPADKSRGTRKEIRKESFFPPLLLHGWSGSHDMSKMFVRNFPNVYYSFSVPLRTESLKGIPINRVLAETDDKDPSSIQNAYRELAVYFGKSEKEMIVILNRNFEECFLKERNLILKDNIKGTKKEKDHNSSVEIIFYFLPAVAIVMMIGILSIRHTKKSI